MITLASVNPKIARLSTPHSRAKQYRRWGGLFDMAADLAERSNPEHAKILRRRARDCRTAAAIRDVVAFSPEGEQEARIRAMEQIYHGADI